VHRDDGVAGVVLARKQRHQLQPLELLVDTLRVGGEFCRIKARGVVLGEPGQHGQVFDLTLQAREIFDLRAQSAQLLTEFLGLVGMAP